MPLLKRQRVLAAKIEGTSGTAETLANADVIYGAYDVMIQPNISFKQRPAQGSFSQDPGTLESYGGTCTFKTELRGDGAAGVPDWAATLFPACGLVESTQTFELSSEAPGTNVKTLTIASYQGGRKKFLRGAAGNVVFNFLPGDRVELEWTFTGVWQPPVDATMLANAASYGTPLRFGNSTFTIGGSAPGCVAAVSLDLGNNVILRPCPGSADGSGLASALITDRMVKGTIDPESRLVATENVFGKWLAGTEEALVIAVGDGTDEVSFACLQVQRTNVQEADRNGIETDSIEFQCNGSAAAGNDELAIEFVV